MPSTSSHSSNLLTISGCSYKTLYSECSCYNGSPARTVSFCGWMNIKKWWTLWSNVLKTYHSLKSLKRLFHNSAYGCQSTWPWCHLDVDSKLSGVMHTMHDFQFHSKPSGVHSFASGPHKKVQHLPKGNVHLSRWPYTIWVWFSLLSVRLRANFPHYGRLNWLNKILRLYTAQAGSTELMLSLSNDRMPPRARVTHSSRVVKEFLTNPSSVGQYRLSTEGTSIWILKTLWS